MQVEPFGGNKIRLKLLSRHSHKKTTTKENAKEEIKTLPKPTITLTRQEKIKDSEGLPQKATKAAETKAEPGPSSLQEQTIIMAEIALISKLAADEMNKETLQITIKHEKEQQNNADLNLAVVGLSQKLDKTKAENKELLLGKQSGDIDIALDNMLGRRFCQKLLSYCRTIGMEQSGFGVIKCKPDQARHLEVAKMEILGVSVDFVHLRPPDYAEINSKSSTLQDFGTIVEDAHRRDLTINSLFYNINTGMVEDPTGRGLADLRAGIIATPSAAKDTFRDDPLRALRALRRRFPPFGTEGKLDGTNYTLWKLNIKALLNSYELLQTATGQDRMPGPTVSPFDPAITIHADLALVTAWQRRDADTLCAIVTSVSDGILPLIQHVSKTTEAWQISQNQYEMRNQTRVQNLKNQLAAEKFDDGESAETFTTCIKNLRDQTNGGGRDWDRITKSCTKSLWIHTLYSPGIGAENLGSICTVLPKSSLPLSVSVLGYELHPDAKDAIDLDIKVALAVKISRERIGAEVERIFRCNHPLKAMELLVETKLFPVIFSPPSGLNITLPEGIERTCLHTLGATIDVLRHFGSSKLSGEHRKSLYLAAFLSPLRTCVYEHKSKLVVLLFSFV
ncbi:hypothetical protein L7F22_059064 [Adiantum nelumboides]|nr:hypothetical protein [Adiantum nelumboides]